MLVSSEWEIKCTDNIGMSDIIPDIPKKIIIKKNSIAVKDQRRCVERFTALLFVQYKCCK